MNTATAYIRQIPPAVRALLLLNTAVFVLQQFFGAWIIANFGLTPYAFWSNLKLWQIGTYLFVHGNFFHLLFNLFSLWMFGKELEYTWGTKEFLKFYFLCGLGAGLVNVLVHPFSTFPTIGASGAIYGILIAFAMVFPEIVVYLYGIIPMKSKNFVLMVAAIEFFSGIQYSSSPIAHFAHLGGMLFGYLYLKSYEFRSLFRRLYQKLIGSLITLPKKQKKAAAPAPSTKSSRKKRTAAVADLDAEVDRILEKVSRQGVESLNSTEHQILRIYSSQKSLK